MAIQEITGTNNLSPIEALNTEWEAIEGTLGTADLDQDEMLLDRLETVVDRIADQRPGTPHEIDVMFRAAAYQLDLIVNSVAEDGEARRARGDKMERILASVRHCYA
jgi:hypothetical protein